MIRLIQAEPDSRFGLPSCVVGRDTIVWVGLDRVAVDALVNDCGQDVGDDAIALLRAMITDGDIDINREFRVMSTVTVTGTLEHVVEASTSSEAEDLVRDMIESGDLEDPDSFVRHADVDDVTIDDVETA